MTKDISGLKFTAKEFNGEKVAAGWIRDLESSDSRKHKESVIEKALVAARLGSYNAQCFLYNCYQAYNPFYVFNVRQVPETEGIENAENPWVDFWGLLESLRTRTVTGHQARNAIAAMSQRFNSEDWNCLARRVLLKDLRCGISEKTLNKVLKNTDYTIPVFSCQLAQDSDDHQNKMRGKKRLEIKLDGVRVIAVVYADGTVNLFSRNGRPFDNFPHIEDTISSHAHRVMMTAFGKPTDYVLDGEVIGKSFQQLMTQARRKTDVDASDSYYYVFDIMTREDFFRGNCNMPQRKRNEILQKLREANIRRAEDPISIVPGIDVDLDTAEGHDVMRRFADDAIAAGYEGIMIKNIDAPYECKRSSHWMKWKPTITVDLAIVGFEEGTGRNVGRLGAFICEGVDNGRKIRTNVGSGFSDEQRQAFWDNRDNLLNDIIEVEADAVTQNQDGTYSLRFPRFKRFRGFDHGEKL